MRKYLLENKKNLIMYIIICFFAAILSAGTAFLYQKLTFFAVSKEFKKLIFLGFIAIPYLTIEAMFDYFPRKFKSKIINNIIKKLREDLIIKIDREDISYLNLDYKKDFKNKMINDLEAINNYFNGILSSLLYIFMFFISLLSAIYIQGTLTFIMLLFSFIPFLSPFISRKILSNKKEEELDSKSAYLENFDEFSENILFIKISKLGSYFNNKLGELADILKDKSIIFESSLAKTFAISYGLGNILYSGTWIIGGFFVYKNLIDLPSLIAMTTLMVTIAGPIQSIADSYSGIISSKKIFDKYLEYLEETNIDKATIEIGKIDKLRFDNVDLKFANNYIIKNINLEIKSGNKCLILGD
ncbi:MAG: ABC transporter transmembrane domain-containing protein, partial [Anaerococcus vaginalis]